MALDDGLARLAEFEPNGFPVLSLYLNRQPDQHGRDNYQTFVRKELRAKAKTFEAGSSERESYDRDVDRINAYLESELKPSANGLAPFAWASADLFQTLQFDAPVDEHRFYVYDQLRLNDEYREYAAVNEKTRTVKAGGWSQQRYRRRTEKFRAEHAKEVVDALERVVRDESVPTIVLAGDEVIVPLLREQMPQQLEDKVVDVLKLDVNAPDTDVLRATLDTMREQDARDDGQKVRRLFEEYRAGGLAAVGVRDTLAALEIGQADEVLVSAALERVHPEEEDLAEPLAMTVVTRANRTGARVSFIENTALLQGVGGVGEFLRYRI